MSFSAAKSAAFDPLALRREFPAFAAAAAPFHYLDSAATSQMLGAALDAVLHQESQRANVARGTYRLAEAATVAYETARQRTARFLNAAAADEVVFTAGATAAINLVASAYRQLLRPGDEIIVSLAEHHSNFVPWQLLRERAGVELKFLPLTADGRIDLARLPELLSVRTRLIAVTHCSNVTGAITDLAAVVAAAKSCGARVLADGAQRVQHGPVDVQALGVDFYAFSGHKCYGPGGIGVLWGKSAALAELPPVLAGGGMIAEVTPQHTSFAEPPQRFEAGTPPIAAAVGLGVALDWMHTLPWEAIHAHEAALLQRLLAGLAEFPGLRQIGPTDAQNRSGIVSFTLRDAHPHDVCQVLDRHGLALRGGHLCAQPLMQHFDVHSVTRASIAPYTSAADIDALIAGLFDVIRVLS